MQPKKRNENQSPNIDLYGGSELSFSYVDEIVVGYINLVRVAVKIVE